MYGIIYKITNKINGKKYIGQTRRSLASRWNKHCLKKQSKNRCVAIYNAIQKYGKENFEIKVLCYANNQEELNYRESYCIKLFKTLSPNGYNLKSGGHNTIYSEVSRKKMSESHKGKGAGENNNFFGRKHTIESRNKISKAGRGRKSPLKGKNLSLEHVKKISKAKKGMKISKEVIARLARSNHVSIICNETGIIYPSIKQASLELNLKYNSICRVLRKERKSYKGYTFSYINNSNKLY